MKKLLIVVDYQEDFVVGSLGFSKAKEIEEQICAKIREYRKEGWTIAFTMDTHYPDYLNTQEGIHLPIPHCIKGTKGWEIYSSVAKLKTPQDLCFCKETFGSKELFEYLKQSDYISIELVGVVTNICVISNAILAKTALPEAIIIVDASAVASNDAKLNEKALDIMENLQIKIINR